MFSTMQLIPKTLIGKQELKKIKSIIQSLIDKPESYDFQTPVDWKSLGLTDYTTVIKNPMDLGTVQEKLNGRDYRFVEEVLDDMQLIWDNCKIYNHPESWIYKVAEVLERSFKKMVKNYMPNISIVVPGKQNGVKIEERRLTQVFADQESSEGSLTYADRQKLSDRLKRLTPDTLGEIVDYIIRFCPEAYQDEDVSKASILIDNIPNTIFKVINEMIDELEEDYEENIAKKRK